MNVINPPPHPNPRAVIFQEDWLMIPKILVERFDLPTDQISEIRKPDAIRVLTGLGYETTGKAVAELREILMDVVQAPIPHATAENVFTSDDGATWEEWVAIDSDVRIDEKSGDHPEYEGVFTLDGGENWWQIVPWGVPDSITSVDQTPIVAPTPPITKYVWDKKHDQYRAVEAVEVNPDKAPMKRVYVRCKHWSRKIPSDARVDTEVKNIQSEHVGDTDVTKIAARLERVLKGVTTTSLEVKDVYGKYIYLMAEAFNMLGWDVITPE